MLQPDSLIFDMDGTLWDNVDAYVTSWNKALKIKQHPVEVTRLEVLKLMGKEAKQMLNAILPDVSAEVHDNLFDEVIAQYQLLLPHMKPHIFDGVHDGLERLSKKYKLFMLSNCEEGGLVNFMKHTKTSHLFTDYMEHGQNLQPKSFNLQLLKQRNGLEKPVYVGDTDSDSRQSTIAGIPFVYMAYGFGKTDSYSLKFNSFPEFTHYFIQL